jgi:hypothetical protein
MPPRQIVGLGLWLQPEKRVESHLPEMKYLGNTLHKEFGIDPETHDEFSRTFRENCQYLGITSGIPDSVDISEGTGHVFVGPETITIAEADGSSKLTAFVYPAIC